MRFFSTLSKEEKEEGGETNLWIYYNRGNTEGYKWFVPYLECINWSKAFVSELKAGEKTNSRWQGAKYYNVTGLGWVDYFTNRLKSFFVEEGVYSKNIVKLHCTNNLLSDKYIVALLNSSFVTYFVKNFITSTHTLQINDGRLIPIFIPNKTQLFDIESVVTKILSLRKTNPDYDTSHLEKDIDKMVFELYGLSEEEIRIVESC